MNRYSQLLLSAIVASALAASAWADDSAPAAAGDSSIAELIKQLDAEDFKARQAASTKLEERGKEAIESLEKAATSDSAEASTRALEILSKHHAGTNAELKAAALAALQKIAATDKGTAARRAAEILNPKPTAPQTDPNVPLGGGRGIRIAPGGIAPGGIRFRVEALGGVGGLKRMSVKNVDGVKEIEAQEGDRTVKINDDPAKGIKVSVTQKKDGKEETKEYEAKNAEELKTKHPEAHEFYKQYAQKEADIRVDVFPAVPGAPGIVPGIAPPLPIAGRARPVMILRDPEAMAEQLDKVQKQLEAASDRLKKIVESADNQAEIKKAIEALDETRKELDGVKAKIER